MNPAPWEDLKSLFESALERPASERAAFLEAACSGNELLRAGVEALLRSHEEAGFLSEGLIPDPLSGIQDGAPSDPGRGSALSEAAASLVGRSVGRYRIRASLAAGGMGVVYEAEQEKPHRVVALKLMRSELGTRAALRRFEHEADLLGRLQHPGIAQIFEAGTADLGHGAQPFLAMELIRGRPITSYAEDRRLGPRERLELLAMVCEAVQHAHLKGVIHRDLKPANILVDASGQAKVLDFGIARATDWDIRTTTLATNAGELIGTLPYMSPEQVAGDPRNLDYRSDVYALGVLGYELVARRLPYDVAGKTVPDAIRIITDEDPLPLGSVDRTLRGDVETILHKALSKDRELRYPSALDLAEDIRRYLRDEPIAARPPSAGYQLRKLVRRHKLPVAMAAAVFVLVSAFGGVATVQAVRIARERDRAQAISSYLEGTLALFDPARTKGRR